MKYHIRNILHRAWVMPLQKLSMEARSSVMNNPDIPSVNKNKEIIGILNSKGLFNIKDSVNSVAKALDISRNTVYLHLRGISEEGKD